MNTSDDPLRDLMNDLNGSLPQADPIFQHQLEQRLITTLEGRKQRRKMQSNGHLKTLTLPEHKMKVPSLNPRRIPLTLVATIAIVIAIGGLFVWFFNDGGNSQSGAVQVETATATAAPSLVPTSTPLPFGTALPTVVPNCTIHVVQEGEMVSGIAAQYGVALSDLLALNNLREDTLLTVGQQLLIPGGECAPGAVPMLLPTIVATVPPPPGYDPNSVQTYCSSMGMSAVVIVRRDLLRGTLLTPDMIGGACYPGGDLGSEHMLAPTDVIGFYLTTDLRTGQPLSSHYLVSHTDFAPYSVSASQLPAGTVSLFLPLEPGIFYGLQIGDQVVVTLNLVFTSLDCDSCEEPPPALELDPGVNFKTIPLNAEVVAIMLTPISANEPPRSLVVLAMQGQDAVIVTWALEAEISYNITVHSPGSFSPEIALQATPTMIATVTSTPIPVDFGTAAEDLPGGLDSTRIRYEPQTWNNQGPATLAMALSYFGTEITQADISDVLRPTQEDKYVSPVELLSFVDHRVDGINAIYRIGGTLELVKTLIDNDFPVIVETGFEVEDTGWFGHYRLPVAVEENAVYVFDSYLGQNIEVAADTFQTGWTQFNNGFIVLYEPAREEELMALLGDDYATFDAAVGVALEKAQSALDYARSQLGQPSEDGFALMNLGVVMTLRGDYGAATMEFDNAFATDNLPAHISWYQQYHWLAYYAVGRYEDVLAQTSAVLDETPSVEAAHFYQGLALAAQGNQDEAVPLIAEALQMDQDQARDWLETNTPEDVVALMLAYYRGE